MPQEKHRWQAYEKIACFDIHAIKEIQMKRARDLLYTYWNWPKSKTLTVPRRSRDAEEQKLSHCRLQNTSNHSEEQFGVFLQNYKHPYHA